MSDAAAEEGSAFVVPLDEAPSYWQPVPANGFVRTILSQANTGSLASLSVGTQTVAPGCMIREHTHDRNEEIIHVVEGRGIARIDGVEHPIERGATVWIGLNRRHHFINPYSEPLTFLWIFTPGGLDGFFAEIGRRRCEGEPAPRPFPRPDDIAEIERRSVFGWTDQGADRPA